MLRLELRGSLSSALCVKMDLIADWIDFHGSHGTTRTRAGPCIQLDSDIRPSWTRV